MTAIDRREILRVMMGGAAVATASFAMLPIAAEAAPMAMSKSLPGAAQDENLVEEAVVVIAPRRRRRVCWWRRGRRVCTWR